MELVIDEKKNIAYIKLSGVLNQETILGAFDLTVADKRYKTGMGRLWDFRDADLSGLDADMISELGRHSLKFPAGINDVKVAFVTSRSLEFGLSRMFGLVAEAKTPTNVFRSMEEAEKWMMETRAT